VCRNEKGRPGGERIIPSGGLIVKRLGQPQPEAFHDQIGAYRRDQA